jgi:hypothetical protein
VLGAFAENSPEPGPFSGNSVEFLHENTLIWPVRAMAPGLLCDPV